MKWRPRIGQARLLWREPEHVFQGECQSISPRKQDRVIWCLATRNGGHPREKERLTGVSESLARPPRLERPRQLASARDRHARPNGSFPTMAGCRRVARFLFLGNMNRLILVRSPIGEMCERCFPELVLQVQADMKADRPSNIFLQ